MPTVHIRDHLFAKWVKKTGEEDSTEFSAFANVCVERCLEDWIERIEEGEKG